MGNPFLEFEYEHRLNAIPFHLIKNEHYIPALETTLYITQKNIAKIRRSKQVPTFENTILQLDMISEKLDYITNIYFNLFNAESDAQFRSLSQKISALMAEHTNSILTDEIIFSKVKAVYEKECLNQEKPVPDFKDPEKMKLCERYRYTEKTFKKFIRNGALLSKDDKLLLNEIDRELNSLGPMFSNNVAEATNAFALHLTGADEVEGIPESVLNEAALQAKNKGYQTGWLFTLQLSSLVPVLTQCRNRKTREIMQKAYASRAYKDNYDNQEILKRILVLRNQRARLLGYKNHVEYVLEERMVQDIDTILGFLDDINRFAYPAAKAELEEIIAYAKELDGITDYKFWDYNYYAARLNEKKHQYNSEMLRPWFKLENVVDGMFTLAQKIFGVSFKKVTDVPVYHQSVTTWEAYNEKNEFMGLLYLDLFPRQTKRGGAWMNSLLEQGLHTDGMKRPHVIIGASLTPSSGEQPSLLRLEEIRTLFNQFGHALYVILSNCYYNALSGNNVLRDFMALPAQLMEQWLYEKEALKIFARHYQTGEHLPGDLLDKVLTAGRFLKNSEILGLIRFSALDLALHSVNPSQIEDIDAFENKVIEPYRLLLSFEGSNIACQFTHIFTSGYSAGFYSYLWAEVLVADVWSLFKEKGIFNQEVAFAFRDIILSRGNSAEPNELFASFRGRQPNPEAFLEKNGYK